MTCTTQGLRNRIKKEIVKSNAQKPYGKKYLGTQGLRNLISIMFWGTNAQKLYKYNDLDTQGLRSLTKYTVLGTLMPRKLINILI